MIEEGFDGPCYMVASEGHPKEYVVIPVIAERIVGSPVVSVLSIDRERHYGDGQAKPISSSFRCWIEGPCHNRHMFFESRTEAGFIAADMNHTRAHLDLLNKAKALSEAHAELIRRREALDVAKDAWGKENGR